MMWRKNFHNSNSSSQAHTNLKHWPMLYTHLLRVAALYDGHGRGRPLQTHSHSSLGSPRPCSYPAGKANTTCMSPGLSCCTCRQSNCLMKEQEKRHIVPVTLHSHMHQAQQSPSACSRQQCKADRAGRQERGLSQISSCHGRQAQRRKYQCQDWQSHQRKGSRKPVKAEREGVVQARLLGMLSGLHADKECSTLCHLSCRIAFFGRIGGMHLCDCLIKHRERYTMKEFCSSGGTS